MERTERRPAINNPRRFALLNSKRQRDYDEQGLSAVFLSKQREAVGQILPDNFPNLDALSRAGYTTVEDLDGAPVQEIAAETGLPFKTCESVLSALDALLEARKIMGYNRGNNPPVPNQYANTLAISLVDQATKTATFTSATQEPGDRGTARLTLNVTAASGTSPTLDVAVNTSDDGATWRACVGNAAFTQKTAAGAQTLSFCGVGKYLQAVCTIGGTTPSFTFSVSGDAV